MIVIDSRKELLPYSDQCSFCKNLVPEKDQECKIYKLNISDDFWLNKKKCPKYIEKETK